jgi:hypothetical protein
MHVRMYNIFVFIRVVYNICLFIYQQSFRICDDIAALLHTC